MRILEEINQLEVKRLPICFPPPITSYLPYSVLSAIICAVEKNNNWVYNNFIQLYYNGIGKVDYYPNSDFAYHDKLCMTITELNQLNYRLNKDNIVNDLKFWINNGNYVSFYLAESKIPGARFFNRSDIIHSQFIFGYNDEKQIFYMMNFGAHSETLEIIELKYTDFFQALDYTVLCNKERKYLETTTMKDIGKDFRIVLLMYNQNRSAFYSPELCIEYIRQQIYDLLEERNSSVHNIYFTSLQRGNWGLSTYDVIKQTYRRRIERHKKIDFRVICLVYEHKRLMKERMLALKEVFGIENCEEEMESIVKRAERLKNTVLKYNLTLNDRIMQEFEIQMDELKQGERDVYTKYIACIDENPNPLAMLGRTE